MAKYTDVRVGMKYNDVQGIMIKAIYEAGGEHEEGWVVNAGDRTNPRSFNWSDRPLRPREFLSLEACHINWCGYKMCYDRTFLVGARPTELQKEIYQTGVEMQARFEELLKPGITTHELTDKRPRPGKNLKTIQQIRQWKANWSNHMGGMGIAWEMWLNENRCPLLCPPWIFSGLWIQKGPCPSLGLCLPVRR